MRTTTILLALSLATSATHAASLAAQSPTPADTFASIRGRTLALVDSAAVQAAIIGIVPLGGTDPAKARWATSDSTGAFRIDSLPAGAYRVRSRRVGFGSTEVDVRLERGEQRELTLHLPPSGYDPEERARELVRLERHRAKWRARAPSTYGVVYEWTCFCFAGYGRWSLEVNGGRTVVRDAPAHSSRSHPPLENLDSLFAMVAEEIRRPNRVVTVQYDPDLGYPRLVRFDAAIAMNDAWTEVRVHRVWRAHPWD